VVFSKVAAPELKKAGYDESLSLGCIASAGSLSSLIPPSIGILTVAILTNISIGTALMTGLSTGIIMVIIMFIFVFVITRVQPKKIAPITEEDRRVTWRERFASLKLLLPILFMFALIVGGSYFGWFPATVGGAVACVVIIIYALYRRMPVKKIYYLVWDGVVTFANIFLIVLASQMFGRFVAISGFATEIMNAIGKAGLPVFSLVAIVIVFYFICGCIMDAMSIIMITIPIIFPLLTSLGFDPFIVCIVLVLMAELGAITPPFGISVFTISAVLKESSTKIFKGTFPFIIIYLVCVIVILCFPQSVLWLPTLLGVGG
jgi:tripartite ATP-independent transporter DctM subunit